MGESITEATIIRWLKNEGDIVIKEDIIVEIATDKVDSEIHSPINGILKKKLFSPKEEVKIGTTIAIIEIISYNQNEIAKNNNIKLLNNNNFIKNRFYSPLIKTIAKKEGIKNSELDSIHGSGKYGRITKEDIFFYLKNRNKNNFIINNNSSLYKKNINNNEIDEIIKMDRIRKIISNNMINSKNTSVHVTSFVESDVTSIVKWRNKLKDNFYKRNKIKLSFIPIFVQAVIKAIKDFPMINISIKNDLILKKKNINIGIATSLSNGNLIVPVIKNADFYSLNQLIFIINDLIERTRLNKLKIDEINTATYTISNIGSFGNILGTPIIHQPQVAILATGFIQKKPSVIETPKGDFIGIRYKMYLSHSYDHRIIDGYLGGSFVQKVAKYLEIFDEETKI